MELQLETMTRGYLRRHIWEVRNAEQTQELRLPEDMPDIGTVLGAWGQCVIRSKEWHNDEIGVSGGVMAWVMYAPADGSKPQSVELWLPMQGKWSLNGSQREGVIRASWMLCSVDARTVSARKLMVRANVGMLAEALEEQQIEIKEAGEIPSDVQLLRRTYPMQLPKEAGEKAFLLEEVLPMPTNQPAMEKIICCHFVPMVSEQKVLGNRIVLRGSGELHILYEAADGQLHSTDMEVPFSQIAELDRDYGKDASVSVMMTLSGLEPELKEDGIHLICGLIAQYLVTDRELVELLEDAYSPRREVRVQMASADFPAVLDVSRRRMCAASTMDGGSGQVVDVSCCLCQPALRRAGDLAEVEISGSMQVLYYDENGDLRSSASRWNDEWEQPVGQSAQMLPQITELSRPAVSWDGTQLRADMEIEVETMTIACGELPMMAAMELGELQPADGARPSLVLRRAGEQTLWELAKRTGSTVDAIRNANGLNDEPLPDRLLLIPVC